MKLLNPFNKQLDVEESQFIKHLSYSRRSRRLTVEFLNGTCYNYGSVEPQVYRNFANAESKGKYFHKHIRGVYPFIKKD